MTLDPSDRSLWRRLCVHHLQRQIAAFFVHRLRVSVPVTPQIALPAELDVHRGGVSRYPSAEDEFDHDGFLQDSLPARAAPIEDAFGAIVEVDHDTLGVSARPMFEGASIYRKAKATELGFRDGFAGLVEMAAEREAADAQISLLFFNAFAFVADKAGEPRVLRRDATLNGPSENVRRDVHAIRYKTEVRAIVYKQKGRAGHTDQRALSRN